MNKIFILFRNSMYQNKLGGYFGKEDLSTEFKEFCIKTSLDIYDISLEEVEELLEGKNWNNKFQIAIEDTLEVYLENIFPKYLSSFYNSGIEGNFYIGIDDDGWITGIPFKGNLTHVEIENKMKDIIYNNIKLDDGEDINELLESIHIEVQKLEIDPLLIADEYTELYNIYKKEIIKRNDEALDYNSKKILWLLELSKYNRKLTEIINSTEFRKELIEFIEDNKNKFQNIEDKDTIIKYLTDTDYVPIPKFDILSERKNNIKDVLYWLVNYKDYYIEKISHKRPNKPLTNRIFGPCQILSKLSLIRNILINIQGLYYYLIKININNQKIKKQIYYKVKNNWLLKSRTISQKGDPYIK